MGTSAGKNGVRLFPTVLATNDTQCTNVARWTLSLEPVIRAISSWQRAFNCVAFRIAANAPIQLHDYFLRFIVAPDESCAKIVFIRVSLLKILTCLWISNPNFLKMSVKMSKLSSRRRFSLVCSMHFTNGWIKVKTPFALSSLVFYTIPLTVSELMSIVSIWPSTISLTKVWRITIRFDSRIFELTRSIHFTAFDFTVIDESVKCFMNAEQMRFSIPSSSWVCDCSIS